jgi:hypothetical protein
MNVYGYTEEKDTVAVDLSIARIVAAGIDPWRLDLCDPDPVELFEDGKKMYFRRLRDLSFAYRIGGDDTIYVGMHDGNSGTCIVGKQKQHHGQWDIRVDSASESGRPFEEHFAEYLLHLNEHPNPEPKLPTRRDQCLFYIYGDAPNLPPIGFNPQCFGAVRLQGANLLFRTLIGIRQKVFVGEMFEELNVWGAPCPEPMRWAFDTMAPFQPVIFGPAVRKSLCGEPVDHVHVIVRMGGMKPLKHILAEQGVESLVSEFWGFLNFVREGCRYTVWNRVAAPLDCDWRYFHSADGLMSNAPHHVIGSRIAFSDAGTKQARMLMRSDLIQPAQWQEALKKSLQSLLVSDGFTILPHPPSLGPSTPTEMNR